MRQPWAKTCWTWTSADGGKDLPVTHLDGQLGGLAQPFAWPIPRKRKTARKPFACRRPAMSAVTVAIRDEAADKSSA